jgi:hypothetical protein
MQTHTPHFDDDSRTVGIVLAVLGSLAFLSFVMAGLVGTHEKAASARAHTPSVAAHTSARSTG